MATTCTDDHGLVSIVESVDCTLYSYIHDQRKRLNIIEIARIGLKLADALKYCHMRGYIHSAISSHCVYFTSTDVKLGGWEMAITKNVRVINSIDRFIDRFTILQTILVCYIRSIYFYIT